MDVRIFPNWRRPGLGLRPHREGQRPLLPLHARHCPVLEAGSALGFLVHPPLAEKEAFHVEYCGEGLYRFLYSVNHSGEKWEPAFCVTFALPLGGLGARKEEVTLMITPSDEAREIALLMARMFIVPDDLGTPAGAVTLRGAWNFQTPVGWDTVYTPIFNLIDRPIAPMFSIRVETDWYVHDTEFRYVLQPGEAINGLHNIPIGQVFFVPREDITLRDCSADELEAIRRARDQFSQEKAAVKVKTAYGLEYSPHYLRTSRQHNPTRGGGVADVSPATLPSGGAVREAGRNDPCPCGSGRKYRKCHGEGA